MTRATGIGSWPGANRGIALRVVRDVLTGGEDPGIPYLPELPDRGPGADLVGRGAGLLAGLAVDLQPSGWRLVDAPGRDAERTRALLRGDLDEAAEMFDGYDGALKVQAAGPWTLAAHVRLPRGERVLADAGACRDVAQSLADGLRDHVADLRRAIPGARPVVQLDEPSLPAVLSGALPTSSGFGRVGAVDAAAAREALALVVTAARAAGVGVVAVHCCAPRPPLPLLREAGVDAVSLDVRGLDPAGWESVAATVEAGAGLWAGVLPTAPAEPAARPLTLAEVLDPLVRPWRDVGLAEAGLDDVVLTPSCGLASSTPDEARAAHRLVADAAKELTFRLREGGSATP